MELFRVMEGHYTSENEKLFFEKMKYKMEYEMTLSNDLLLLEQDNEDHIYLIRCIYDEFIIGQGCDGQYKSTYHAMNLSEALSVNLGEQGFTLRDITLHEWLRERDYRGINYQNNLDFE